MIEYGVIIQARMGSSRRPKKVTAQMNGEEMLSFQIKRLLCNNVSNIIIATTDRIDDDVIEEIGNKCNVPVFRGSENNLINRFYTAARHFHLRNIIRVGGDDPLIDPECIKALIIAHRQQQANFIYASHKEGWIYGTAAELFEFETLKRANESNTTALEQEHIIPFIKGNTVFSQYKIKPSDETLQRADIFFSVDYDEDIQLINDVLYYFLKAKKQYSFTQQELVNLYDSGLIRIKNKALHQGFAD